MPIYVNKVFFDFWHPPPQKQQDQPYPHVKPTYGAKTQYSQKEDDYPTLDKAGKKFIQEVYGVFLFLTHVVDGGLLLLLSSLASQQANPTEKTLELCKQFLDHMATQKDAILTYRTSDMVLAIHSNAVYLSKPKSCSRTGGHRQNTLQQWPCLQYFANDLSSCGIRTRGRIGCPIHHHKKTPS